MPDVAQVIAEMLKGMVYSGMTGADQFGNLPNITRDSRIHRRAVVTGHVSKPLGEVLYTDREGENKDEYERAYVSAVARARRMPGGERRVENMVQAVYDEITERTKYNKEKVEKAVKKAARDSGRSENGIPIENMAFIKAGFGVCRHMGLACASLLEMAQERGLIEGTANFHRSRDVIDEDRTGGHAWARFTDKSGRRFILDVAQGYCGLLENGPAQGWNYCRDDEVRPPNTRQYVTLGKHKDGNWRIAESVVTTDRVFKSSDLDTRENGKYDSYLVETSSGNRYVVGWDNDSNKAFVVAESDFYKGELAAKQPLEDMQLRVGDPIEFQSADGKTCSTSIKRIVAVGRYSIEDPGKRNAKPDREMTEFRQVAGDALRTKFIRLGTASDDRITAGSNKDQRIGRTYRRDGTSINVGAVLGKECRKAWLHTRSGNVYEIERQHDGTLTIADVNTAKADGVTNRRVVTSSLNKVTVGSSFNYGSGETTSVQALTLEMNDLLTPTGAQAVSGGAYGASIRAAEEFISSHEPKAQVLQLPTEKHHLRGNERRAASGAGASQPAVAISSGSGRHAKPDLDDPESGPQAVREVGGSKRGRHAKPDAVESQPNLVAGF